MISIEEEIKQYFLDMKYCGKETDEIVDSLLKIIKKIKESGDYDGN